ncbi:MAG: zeta toxin family protein [Gammaproteobacteria bacterium]|nr:zeta toxin family protein [Gammaproteobacteria bacterium]
MADQLDNRPVFTMMGCNGVGKSAWKRANYDLLPSRYFDLDSIAGGIGDWNSEDARRRTATIAEVEIQNAIAERVSYGIESTYSGRPGRERVEQAKRAGYRVEGIYLGTESPEVNVARIERRVSGNTGRQVDPKLVRERYRWSLSNLRRTVEQFDQLEVLDNSLDGLRGIPNPVEQCCLKGGKVVSRLADRDTAAWCKIWLKSVERSMPPSGSPPRANAAGLD